ncbi:hypothetical protein CBOM_01058 [Ceraceosorus bombacis]|uniref:Uncharacterized protein n=1 Tax=Ceraceosorus bombacis TaxID=401625 RepID=A0A0P1BC80_9BASI|nr:hypothetical protein CBOM_01058 [Ceraceosorus bombacis]
MAPKKVEKEHFALLSSMALDEKELNKHRPPSRRASARVHQSHSPDSTGTARQADHRRPCPSDPSEGPSSSALERPFGSARYTLEDSMMDLSSHDGEKRLNDLTKERDDLKHVNTNLVGNNKRHQIRNKALTRGLAKKKLAFEQLETENRDLKKQVASQAEEICMLKRKGDKVIVLE